MSARLVVVGAGPTGLGAATRLQERGHDDWVLLEASDTVGGLARSVTDEQGCTWDIGGHVLFSHYPAFTDALERALGDEWRELQREAWVWMRGRFLPYPFQNNLRHLDPHTVYECLAGLVAAQRHPRQPANFRQWLDATFGEGMARHFLAPYNTKVWATPLERMAFGWIGERVAVVDVDTVLRNVVLGQDQPGWGPNSTFRYPLRGGTGSIYRRLAEPVAERVRFGHPVTAVDVGARTVTTADGGVWPYDALLSTMPLDDLVAVAGAPPPVRAAAASLAWTTTHVVGVAVDRRTDTTRNWIYYPEPDLPFHRVTYLSNYSPHLAARPGQTLLLTETSSSAHRRADHATLPGRVVDGLVRVGLLAEADRSRVASVWSCRAGKAYPVPTLGRDRALACVEPWVERHGIASRGRFGAWRYEIGNMDHSFMQGVEWVDRVLSGQPETVWTPACA